MNAIGKFSGQRLIDGSMAFDTALAGKAIRNNPNAKVRFATWNSFRQMA